LYRAKITAVAFHVPDRVVTNAHFERTLDTSDEWIRTRTGIRERHFVRQGQATSDLAAQAALKICERRGMPPLDIECIIIATVTPDMFFPSTACIVQDKIGARNAWGFDLSGACAGFVFALSTGSQFVHSGAYRKVLVVGADVMSSILDPTDRNTCVLFGDGAGAVLLERAEPGEEGILDFILKCDGSGGKHLHMPGGGSRNPATGETVRKKMHVVHQDGRAVFKNAVQGIAELSAQILSKNGIRVSDLTLYAPHQANMRIIDAVVDRLGIDPGRVARNIERFANTTAASIPIGLAEAWEQGKLHPGDLVLVATFGAGFTSGSLLMRWSF
jgi:3-oxoacyl-[acyl-carrier-protein] synthase III